MLLEGDMMECGNGPCDRECEMRREMLAELTVVYYRGRFWAATAWSKVGQPLAADRTAIPEAKGTEAKKPAGRQADPGLQTVR